MIYIYFLFFLLIIVINFDFKDYDLKRICDYKTVRFIISHSYQGLIEPIRKCGKDYSIKQYLFHCLIFGGSVSVVYYMTGNSLKFSVFLFASVAVIIPYVYFLNIRTAYLEYMEENIFIYAMNIIIYLKENYVVSDVLLKTSESLGSPMKQDIENLNKYINDTNNFNEALDLIENKYNYSVLRNVHILLKNARENGYVSNSLYDYTFQIVEEYQLQLNNYRNKKKASRNLFYFMEFLDFAGVLFLVKMFADSAFINGSDYPIALSVFIFYVLNIITVVMYERFCMKINSIEKGINL